MRIEKVLEKLERLLRSWGLTPDDWSVLGEWAMFLRGYKVKERKGVLDICADRDRLPWQVKKERSAVPPKDSKEFDQWVSFIEETRFGVDIFPLPQGPFRKSKIRNSVFYSLPNGKRIRLNRALSEVRAHTWMVKKREDAKDGTTKRWREFVGDIRKSAKEKGETRVVKACDEFLREYRKRYGE